MAISVTQLRISFIWASTVPQLFTSANPGYWAGDAVRYLNAFQALQIPGATAVNGARLPWLERSRQRFWMYYAQKDQAQKIDSGEAWKLMIPFRVSRPLGGLSPPPGMKLLQEGYLFPHSMGFILGITVDIDATLADAVDKACSIRHDKLFALNGQPIGAQGIGEAALHSLLTNAAGPEAVASMKPLQPFSIISVTRASGAESLQTVLDGDATHRALEGFVTLGKTWRENKLPPLDQGRTRQGDSRPEEHLLYAAKRGRVIWHPHYFTSTGDKRAPLNCYHRNLSFASLQTQSLLELIDLVTDERGQGNSPTGRLNDCARRASGILGRMYGGVETTYRSHTVRRQIDESGRAAAVNAERKARGMAPLA